MYNIIILKVNVQSDLSLILVILQQFRAKVWPARLVIAYVGNSTARNDCVDLFMALREMEFSYKSCCS